MSNILDSNMGVIAASQAFHPFTRLRSLLKGITPYTHEVPVKLTIGEPQNQPPDFLFEAISRHNHNYNRYPPPLGMEALRSAQAKWLERRYTLPQAINPLEDVIVTAGSREGLSKAIAFAIERKRLEGYNTPKVALPNPFYHSYLGSTLACGGQPLLFEANATTGHMPNYASLTDKSCAAIILCNPANPQGTTANHELLVSTIKKAQELNALALFDECYSEIYRQVPPPGLWDIAQETGLRNCIAFHSLSKRSSAAGLRCGFASGDKDALQGLGAHMKFTSATVPVPLQYGAISLLENETHVEANRIRYNQAYETARLAFAGKGQCPIPEGGFLLWLPVKNAEEACVKLWQEEAIQVLPSTALNCNKNNGEPNYLRIALVFEPDFLSRVLERLANCLHNAGLLLKE